MDIRNVIFGFLIFYLHYVACDDANDKKFQEECQKETGVKKEDLGSTELEKLPKPAKCFLACMAEKNGDLTKDGINLEKAKENIEIFLKKAGKLDEKELSFMAAEECAKEVKPDMTDKCEAFYKFIVCHNNKLGSTKKD